MSTMTDKARAKVKDRARKGWHRITVPHHCGDCNKDYRTIRAMNAHHMSVHAGLWGSKKARAAGRAMGKGSDAARRHAMGWRVASGLAEVRGQRVVATNKSRARPELSGRLKIKDLRRAHKHDRAHDRTKASAAKREKSAEKARVKGRTDWDGIHTSRAAKIRERHDAKYPQRQPAARPVPARPAPARPAPAANGHVNGQLNGRTARTPTKTGRTRT